MQREITKATLNTVTWDGHDSLTVGDPNPMAAG